MWQNFQGAVQVERAHQDPRGGSDFPVQLLWQRLEEQAKSESSHVTHGMKNECSDCGKFFSTPNTLAIHQRDKHGMSI